MQGQVDCDERAETGLHGGGKEIHPVQAGQAARIGHGWV